MQRERASGWEGEREREREKSERADEDTRRGYRCLCLRIRSGLRRYGGIRQRKRKKWVGRGGRGGGVAVL